eukprot:TRINITY_DN8804_c0_g2_i2.p6 TRINITY_DN8804_c0_g2~~TRINITY_DN8804_c0_g2_i2.p6  ORF type:complete len:126 (-),score=9.64 TRINITY_DN8804_c0_g2_i2:1045-1383(-)
MPANIKQKYPSKNYKKNMDFLFLLTVTKKLNKIFVKLSKKQLKTGQDPSNNYKSWSLIQNILIWTTSKSPNQISPNQKHSKLKCFTVVRSVGQVFISGQKLGQSCKLYQQNY